MVLHSPIEDYTQCSGTQTGNLGGNSSGNSGENLASEIVKSDTLAKRNLDLMERFRHYLWLERGLSDNTLDSYSSDIKLFAVVQSTYWPTCPSVLAKVQVPERPQDFYPA